jgi:hypothetical protein
MQFVENIATLVHKSTDTRKNNNFIIHLKVPKPIEIKKFSSNCSI